MPGEKSDWADDKPVIVAKQGDLPAPREIVEDGIKKIISYERTEEGKILKRTQIFRIETRKEEVNDRILARRKWSKFGAAKNSPPGPDPATTSVGEDVYLVLKSKAEVVPDQAESSVKAPKSVVCRRCKGDHWTSKCPYKDNIEMEEPTATTEVPAGTAVQKKSGVYVPPSQRGGAGASRGGDSMDARDDSATVRVTNLSENTREEDLRELFRPFGHITRCYLAQDKHTGQAKGFAFISYTRKEEAQKAIDNISGHGYDHLILKVEWAKPNIKNN